MPLIKREAITHAERKREEVEVAALGGSVAVVQMGLATRLAVEAVARRHDRADPAAMFVTIPHALAGCVLDADDAPLMTPEQWSVFGVANRDTVVELFNAVMRLSGIGEDAEKNS